jgi:hypothetical protein
MAFQAATFCRTRVVLRSPGQEFRIRFTEATLFAHLQPCQPELGRDVEEYDQVECVFEFLAPIDLGWLRISCSKTAARSASSRLCWYGGSVGNQK